MAAKGIETVLPRLSKQFAPHPKYPERMQTNLSYSRTPKGYDIWEWDRIVDFATNWKEDWKEQYVPIERIRTTQSWLILSRMKKAPAPRARLIKIGDEYWVYDGNHRIAVEKLLGKKRIKVKVIQYRKVK